MQEPSKPRQTGRLGVWLPTLAIVAAIVGFYFAYQARQEVELISPEDYESWYSLGVGFQGRSECKKAVRAFEQATRLKPDSDTAWARLGLAYTDCRQYQKAVDAFNRALQTSPDNANTYNNLGIAYKGLKDYEKAVASYQRALAMSPDLLKAHFNLGNAYREKGDCEKAAGEYRTVLQKEAKDGDALYNLARCDSRLKNYAEAVNALSMAISVNPSYVTLAVKDPDFGNMKDNPEFKALLRMGLNALQQADHPAASPGNSQGGTS